MSTDMTLADLEEGREKQARQAYSVAEFCARWGIGRAHAYKLAGSGRLKFSKILGKTVILAADEIKFAELVANGGAAK